MNHSATWNLRKLSVVLAVLAILAAVPSTALSVGNLPAAQAGTIGNQQGQIAFIRKGDIWVMDANGANQHLVCEAANADGRLSWSPDGKKIVFTRSGKVNVQTPDNSGGLHKLYDLFLVDMDSAYANKTLFWLTLTGEMGSRGPEWSADGKSIIFWKDMNANLVNAFEPNYQIGIMNPQDSSTEMLRKDRPGDIGEYLVAPSMNASGLIACVSLFDQRMQGLVILPKEKFMIPMDSIKSLALKNPNCVAPAWSGDGKWLAYINNDLNDGSLYLATPDLKERYLVFTPPSGISLYTVAPSFSPDSKWLTFSTNDGSIWVCDITGKRAQRLSGPGADRFPAWSKTP